MQAHGTHARPERLYWNAAGEYVGTLAPECTRKPRTRVKPVQLGLFAPTPSKPTGEGE